MLICVLLPVSLFAQNLAGTWKGNLTSAEGLVQYELVITGAKGDSYSGYALSKFTFAGIENIGIKKITIRKKKDDYFLEDGELVFNNYTTKPRRVILTGRLIYQQAGSNEMLTGHFSTRSLDMRAREQDNMNGAIQLKKEFRTENLAIIDKLVALNLIAANETKQAPVTEKNITRAVSDSSPSDAGENEVAILAKPNNLPQALMPRHPSKRAIIPGDVAMRIVPVKVQPLYYAYSKPGNPSIANPADIANDGTNKADQVKPQARTSAANSGIITEPSSDKLNTAADLTVQAIIAERKTEIIRSVTFKSDSLVIRLYDNGEIDGDTVSVLLNGRVIIARKGLTASPISHTIYITPDLGNELQLTMYAENLGSLPPNTGLLIIQDGMERHSISFSGDFQKNSAIILKRNW